MTMKKKNPGRLNSTVDWGDLPQRMQDYSRQGDGLPRMPLVLPRTLKIYMHNTALISTTRQFMHPKHILIFVLEGELHFQMEDQEKVLRSGELFLLAPFTRHNFFISPRYPAQSCFASWFEEDTDGRLQTLCGRILKPHQQEIRELRRCAELSSRAFQCDDGCGGECVLVFALLLKQLLRHFAPCPESLCLKRNALSHKKELLQSILGIIHKKPDAGLSIGTIAEKVHLSEIRVRQLFKAEMNCSIGNYIRTRALTEAAFLVKSTGLSFSEIAQRVGYSGSGSLETAMRRETGKTLSQIRRENQE